MTFRGPNEASTCSGYVAPAIRHAGWTANQVTEQYAVQAELPVPMPGAQHKRFADYVLEFEPGVPLIVIEAKRLWALPGDGLQQAIRYAAMLNAPFALSTNGTGWALHNLITGLTSPVAELPTPVEAWDLYSSAHGLNDEAQALLLSRFSDHHRAADGSVRRLRYYQTRAVHAILTALTNGDGRVLAVMATGTGKTFTAMQLVWKLWSFRRAQQKLDNSLRNYRVLYLADRDVLVKDPLNKTFAQAFGRAAVRMSSKNTKHSPDIYFATYQALDSSSADAEDDTGEVRDLLSNYSTDFFDLIIVDECHRGSAREESAWRAILVHFAAAAQLGLTATPVSKGAVDTYEYFGNPVYQYSLREGIEDGFLAPYTIRRVEFDVDAFGVDIAEGMLDAGGRQLAAGTYTTRDFERSLSLPDRTQAMANVIDRVIGDTSDRAVVFCVDSEHALTMVNCLRNLRPERTRADPEWVVRIMSVERDRVRLLEQFTEPERSTPQIAVTTRLLSTGVDIQDLRYVIIARPVGSVPEFKQIIGRGTRLYPDKGKYEFEIVDFVGATTKFGDPDFDGPPLKSPIVDTVDGDGQVVETTNDGPTDVEAGAESAGATTVEEPEPRFNADGAELSTRPERASQEKFSLSGLEVAITSEGFWVHDLESGMPRLVSYVDWTRDRILDSFTAPDELLAAWSDPGTRSGVLATLSRARIDPERLTAELGLLAGEPIDTVDQLLQLTWNRPAQTRAGRATRARVQHEEELAALSDKARAVLELLLDVYATAGITELSSSAITKVPPVSELGTSAQIASAFGGASNWHRALAEVQHWLYSA